MDVQVAELAADVASHFIKKVITIFEPAENPLAGVGSVLGEAHGGAPLGVGRHQHRQLRHDLQLVHAFDERPDRPAHDDHAAHAVVANQRILPDPRRILRIAADLEHDKLCNLLPHGKLLHHRLNLRGVPGVRFGIGDRAVAARCAAAGCQQDGKRQGENQRPHPRRLFTAAEMARPSATPARRLEATPITLPMSRIEVAPTSAMISLTWTSSSSGESCFGK